MAMAIDPAAFNTSIDGVDPRSGDWGLCRAAYEKDSCGFGLIASLDDQASHWVLQTAISSLNRLTHRGAIAADGKTGDGCGLLIKQPTAFLRAVAAEAGLTLAPMFAAGLVFLDRDAAKAAEARKILTEQLQLEKLHVAGFRALPVDPNACGSEALKTLPTIEQVFVNAGGDLDEATFNRKLYMARRRTDVLCPVLVGKHHRLQGHGDAAVPGAVLSRSQGSADGGVGRGLPPAIFHQHLAAVAPRPSLSLPGPQRRDQHGARQPELGGGAGSCVSFAGVARSQRHPAPGVVDRVRFAVARQHARVAAR